MRLPPFVPRFRTRARALVRVGAHFVYECVHGGVVAWPCRRIQAVPEDPQSFACRKPLPAPWAGLRDQELSSVACVPDCIFIHAGRFIGGNKTYEGVLAMAEKALLM
ncbi:hypothetical protein EON62_04310 [archaeon]|nr:MAG: hypothetical protein EON62_04310 [archaeon]